MHYSKHSVVGMRGLQLNAYQILLVLFALVLGYSSLTLAGRAQNQGKQPRSEPTGCWPGGREIQNPNPGRHRPGRLPLELANAKVQRSVMLLKVCISETGDVPRVLVLESSGNPDVDKYYTTQLMKWTFTPVERANKKVPSVIRVAITLYVK